MIDKLDLPKVGVFLVDKLLNIAKPWVLSQIRDFLKFIVLPLKLVVSKRNSGLLMISRPFNILFRDYQMTIEITFLIKATS